MCVGHGVIELDMSIEVNLFVRHSAPFTCSSSRYGLVCDTNPCAPATQNDITVCRTRSSSLQYKT